MRFQLCVPEVYKGKGGSGALEYASIAERVIENDRPKTKTLKYLGPVKAESDRDTGTGTGGYFRNTGRR